MKGEADELDDLLSLTPDAVADRAIDLRQNHEVVAIDTDARTDTVEHAFPSFSAPK